MCVCVSFWYFDFILFSFVDCYGWNWISNSLNYITIFGGYNLNTKLNVICYFWFSQSHIEQIEQYLNRHGKIYAPRNKNYGTTNIKLLEHFIQLFEVCFSPGSGAQGQMGGTTLNISPCVDVEFCEFWTFTGHQLQAIDAEKLKSYSTEGRGSVDGSMKVETGRVEG